MVRVIWDEGSFGNMKLVDGGMRAFQINDPISPSLLYKNGEVEKTVMNYDMVELSLVILIYWRNIIISA